MRTADIVYFAGEPVAFGAGLCQQLQRHGLCHTAIAMPHDYSAAIEKLRASRADCVVFLSPHAVADFITTKHAELVSLDKPLLGYVSEWIAGNDLFPAGRDFHSQHNWLHYYSATQMSDVQWFRGLGMSCDFAQPMFANELFSLPPKDHPRKKKLAYIGHNNPWKTERLRVLQALESQSLVDAFGPPTTIDGASEVAAVFQSYEGVLCPQAHGRAHSIRCYEAAACGALIVECQQLDDGNELFIDGQHRISFAVGTEAEDIRQFVRGLDYEKLRHIAKAGAEMAHEEFCAQVGFNRFLCQADKALTG